MQVFPFMHTSLSYSYKLIFSFFLFLFCSCLAWLCLIFYVHINFVLFSPIYFTVTYMITCQVVLLPILYSFTCLAYITNYRLHTLFAWLLSYVYKAWFSLSLSYFKCYLFFFLLYFAFVLVYIL